MKLDKSPRPDGIYLREEIAGALAKVFASSLAADKVPEDWRIATFIP